MALLTANLLVEMVLRPLLQHSTYYTNDICHMHYIINMVRYICSLLAPSIYIANGNKLVSHYLSHYYLKSLVYYVFN